MLVTLGNWWIESRFLGIPSRLHFVALGQIEGRKWGVRSVVVEFGVFGAPRFSVQRS